MEHKIWGHRMFLKYESWTNLTVMHFTRMVSRRTWKFLEGGIALLGFISFSVTQHSLYSETAWCKCTTKRFVIVDSQPMVSWLPLVCITGGLFTTIYGLRVNIFVQDLRETFIAMDVNGSKLNQRSFFGTVGFSTKCRIHSDVTVFATIF